MRRIILLSSLLLLVSCGKPMNLKPSEVLQRANLTMQQLTSATFSGSVQASTVGQAVHLSFEDGVFHSGGQIWSFTLREDGTGTGGILGHKSHIVADMAFIGGDESDVRPRELKLDGWNGQGEKMAGSWWRLPIPQTVACSPNAVPNAALMQMESRAVRVVSDDGPQEMLDGTPVYHYGVRLDPPTVLECLRTAAEARGEPFDDAGTQDLFQRMTARGEIWIDKKTFFIRKISWSILPKNASDKHVWSIRFALALDHHNAAPDIQLPQNVQVLPSSAAAHIVPALSAMLSFGSAGEKSVPSRSTAPPLP